MNKQNEITERGGEKQPFFPTPMRAIKGREEAKDKNRRTEIHVANTNH